MSIRTSNIELLRIVLILMVICLHYLNGADWAGGVLGHVIKGSPNYYLAHFIESSCIMAVNTFILITGYFSCYKTNILLAKPIKLYSLLVLYGLLGLLIMLYDQKPVLDFQTLKWILNTIFYRWFVIMYCALYVLIPFINKFIHALTQKQLLNLLIINALIFYVINTLSPWKTINDNGYGIVNFINLYLVGAYLRLYRPQPFTKKIIFLIFWGSVILTTIFSFFPCNHAWSYLSFLNLISAIAIFDFFRTLNIKKSPFINYLSSYTFAIYIIHECVVISPLMYRHLFKSYLYWNSPYMCINLGICVIGIYCLCLGIEFIRRLFTGKILDYAIDKITIQVNCK